MSVLDSREEQLPKRQRAEDESRLEELESLKAKLLEMQQAYDESQRTVAELRAHNASLQSDKQQAQEILGLERLKLSEAEKQHKSVLAKRDAALAKAVEATKTAELGRDAAREIARDILSERMAVAYERDAALAKAAEEKRTAELGRDAAREIARDILSKRMAVAFERDAALAKAAEWEKIADDRVKNTLKVNNEMADKRAAYWQKCFEEAETRLAIVNKRNAMMAAELLESTQRLQSWHMELEHWREYWRFKF